MNGHKTKTNKNTWFHLSTLEYVQLKAQRHLTGSLCGSELPFKIPFLQSSVPNVCHSSSTFIPHGMHEPLHPEDIWPSDLCSQDDGSPPSNPDFPWNTIYFLYTEILAQNTPPHPDKIPPHTRHRKEWSPVLVRFLREWLHHTPGIVPPAPSRRTACCTHSSHCTLSCFKYSNFFSFFHTVQLVGTYLPDQRLNPDPQQWECGGLTTGPPGNSHSPQTSNLSNVSYFYPYI